MADVLDEWLQEAAAIAGTPEWLMACQQVEQLLDDGERFAAVRFEHEAFSAVAAKKDMSDAVVAPLADEAFVARATQTFVELIRSPSSDDITRILSAIALLLLMRDKTLMARMVFAAQLADDHGLNALIDRAAELPFLDEEEAKRLLAVWEKHTGNADARFMAVAQVLDEAWLLRLEQRLTAKAADDPKYLELAHHFSRHRVLLTIASLRGHLRLEDGAVDDAGDE